MHLTNEQLDAVRCGESVHLQEAGTDVVVLRADVFERLRYVLTDGGAWLDDAMYLLSPENADLPGWEGAEVAQNQDSQS